MHHKIDRIRLKMFAGLLRTLEEVETPQGPLLDRGFTVWTNQIATGSHEYVNVPYVIAGSAGGYFKQGQFLDLPRTINNKLLNTFANAAGMRKSNGDLVDDLGDGSLPRGHIPQLLA